MIPYYPELYVHELDRRALMALEAFPNLIKLRELYRANVTEKQERLYYLSSAIRLSEKQMPEIYQLLPPVCEKLGIEEPELYFVQSEENANAWTFGSVNPFICVNSKLVNELSHEQISSVLAHEAGHIACKHNLYHSLAVLLARGVTGAVLAFLPGIQHLITPAVRRALLLWNRCSELSADRAAVLCDGNAERTISVLLKVHGYGDNINVEEFILQAMSYKELADDSFLNKAIGLNMTKERSHPLLAIRAYECFEWAKSSQFQSIISSTVPLAIEQWKAKEQISQEELMEADLQISPEGLRTAVFNEADPSVLDAQLADVNQKLEKYTSIAGKEDYAFAVASGLITGFIDSVFIGQMNITKEGVNLSHKQINQFIEKYAEERGIKGRDLTNTIDNLEKAFPVLQDNVWKGGNIRISASDHHLADFAHHPTLLGLVSALAVHFLRIGTFMNRDGDIYFIPLKTSAKDMIGILAPAVITGVLNWLVVVGQKKLEESSDGDLPEFAIKLAHLVASTPIILEIVKCVNNWFGHLVSDMGGSKQTAGGGMGIPGVFVSMLYEISALPILKDSGLPEMVRELYTNQKMDLRHEVPLYKEMGKQAIPVALNEILVRLSYFLSRLAKEFAVHKDIQKINWKKVIPFGNRTINRMLTVSSMTFTIADTTDAAVRAAIESGGNWAIFAGKFVTRFNYVGAGRAAIAIMKEISNEQKEAQLIHEKLILTEAKTLIVLKQLQEYKAALEQRVCEYLIEDIEAFLSGFDLMKEGLSVGDSDLVIKGNVVIQKTLGREVQFTNQKEFDELMESDASLQM